MALIVFAVTLFISAFILFMVQPIIGKLILPKLGGTPQVWNTCMVFFQMVLLFGYGYTHFVSTRLKHRQQLILHGILLLVPLAVLFPNPFDVSSFVPDLGKNPIPSTLWLLLTIVGLPFFVVSTSAPLLQKWFVATGHPAAKDPYFLYGASNLGSMLSLPLYVFVMEPTLLLNQQKLTWSIGYLLLAVTVFVCIAMVWNPKVVESPGEKPAVSATAIQPEKKPVPPTIARTPVDEEVTWARRIRWVLLAAVPSSLMLGVTTHITTDLSPMPLFWMIPLEIYLLSFIFVFATWPVIWTEAPHTMMLFLQPFAIVLMLMAEFMHLGSSAIYTAITLNVLGFFFTVMVCHGEMAKDRPSTKHLTEFYLAMSVGGVIGGLFNALLAPVFFIYVIEFGVAVFAACILRPKLADFDWLDYALAGFGGEATPEPAPVRGGARNIAKVASGPVPTPSMATTLDFVAPLVVGLFSLLFAFPLSQPIASMLVNFLGRDSAGGASNFVMFGVPLLLACAFMTRPLRFGLCVGVVLLIQGAYSISTDTSIFADRSYFGVIRVKRIAAGAGARAKQAAYTQLIHGHIDHGMNLSRPDDEKDWGKPDKDWSRHATTYYHRWGPAGRGMEKFNWFPNFEMENTYWADTRMPGSMVAEIMGSLTGIAPLPTAPLVNFWSEPPFATVGLGTGTMASYGRPYQHVHYYEIDDAIRRLSLPGSMKKETFFSHDALSGANRSKAYFTYLWDAVERGSHVQVLMGDARLRMAMPYKNYYTSAEGFERGGGPDNFYHLMVVDAFSSDAIPAHLITKEAIEMYFEKLSWEGVLCVHTSNRFVDLPKVVASVSSKIVTKIKGSPEDELVKQGTQQLDSEGFLMKGGKYVTQSLVTTRGHDIAPYKNHEGHYTSEWIMVARHSKYMTHLTEPPGYREAFNAERKNQRFEPYWTKAEVADRFVWTDDYYNLASVLR